MAETLSQIVTRPPKWSGAWGVSDCLHWALSAHAAARNGDLRDRIPRYRTRIGALRALTRLGFRTLADALDAYALKVPSVRARPGDICMIADGRIGACGVVIGADALFYDAAGGVTRHPVRGLPVWRAV